MLVGAYSQTVQKCVWTNLQEKSRYWKCGDDNLFYEDPIAQGRHLPSVPMHRDKKNHRKKGRKRTRSDTDARKEEEPARQDHLGQEGVTSMKLAEQMNDDRSFVDRIVREAAVKTNTRIRRSEFRPELEHRQKMDCGKDNGRNAHFEPHLRRDRPLAVP